MELKTASDEEIKQKITELSEEHRDLDEAIDALEEHPHPDELQLTRMKKRKLHIRDVIMELEHNLN